jgi:hypothetical protein
MFNPGSLVRCKMLGGIYTPLGIIIREAYPMVYEVLVMHNRGPNRQCFTSSYLEIVSESW